MKKFAGSITLEGNKLVKDFLYKYTENMSIDGNKVLYVYGETEKQSSEELLDYFIIKFGELVDYDISIEGEDKIDFFGTPYSDGLYELSTYEGEGIDFDTIVERFKDFDGVVSIREAEISNKFGNKIIKVDFVY